MNDSSPVYNSRIIKTYVEYLREEHPGVNVEAILQHAGMTTFEVEDQGHWFCQRQIDRFQEKVVELTGQPDIAREAGRFAASAKGLGPAKQVALGLTSLASGYGMISRIYPLLSRGASVKATRLGATQVEIISRPVEGIPEKPFQCLNRVGFFEALGRVFLNHFPVVEHPECFHRGDAYCRYLIRWENLPSLRWRVVRNCVLLAALPVAVAAVATVPMETWLAVLLFLTCLIVGISWYAQVLAKRELTQVIESQGDMARQHIEGLGELHSNTLLVQEIGQATSRVLDTEQLVRIIAENLERHLNHDRGMILLGEGSEGGLRCVAAYGGEPEARGCRGDLVVHCPGSSSSQVWVWNVSEPTPPAAAGFPSPEAAQAEALARAMGVNSLIAVPIRYEEKVLGLLAVGDMDEKRRPTQSDLSLLRGVASQAAGSLINARSFRKLQESEEKYRNILETIAEAYFEVDLAGNFTFFNESFCRITGYTRSELLGANYRTYAAPETAARLQEVFAQVYRSGESSEAGGVEIVTKGGSTRHIELSTSLARGPSGRPAGFRGIVRDVTDRIQAERERARLEAQLRQSQKLEAIGTLAGGIAHDFNNILSAIVGYSELAALGLPDGHHGKKNILEVLKASQRAKELVRQILAFSRRTESRRQPVELQAVVSEALRLLRASLPATIEIRQHLLAPGRIIQADPTQIHQILMNLGTNARHAMQHAGGILEVALSPCEWADREPGPGAHLPPGAYLSLEVRDTGPGMEAAILERIFEPFFTTKGPGEGTGMGLAVVHGIVEAHGGAIRVSSRPGQGAVFQVLLPCVQGKADLVGDPPAPPPAGRERILFVDDEIPLNNLAKQMLEGLGYEVEPNSSPLDALEAFRARPGEFHLVITDKTMPQMTGFRLAAEVKRIRDDIPIILCTGFGDSGDGAKARAAGIARTLMKPLSMNTLASAVREVLDGHGAPPEVPS